MGGLGLGLEALDLFHINTYLNKNNIGLIDILFNLSSLDLIIIRY